MPVSYLQRVFAPSNNFISRRSPSTAVFRGSRIAHVVVVVVAISAFSVVNSQLQTPTSTTVAPSSSSAACPALGLDPQCSCAGSWANIVYQISINCDNLGHRSGVPSFTTSAPPGVFQNLNLLGGNSMTSSIDNIQANAFAVLPVVVINAKYLSIKTIDPLAFNGSGPAQQLQYIYLDGNQLTVLPPKLFQGLTQLTYVSLLNNQLPALGLDETTFSGAPKLSSLYLSANNLDPAIIAKLPSSLKELYFTGNGLSVLPAASFVTLSSLTDLDLSSNALVELPPKIFQNQSSLLRLYLARNKLTVLPETVFQSLSVLRILNLSSNAIANFPPSLFTGVKSAVTIDLSYNQILDLTITGLFSGNKKVTTVDLTGNGMTIFNASAFIGAGGTGLAVKLGFNNLVELIPGSTSASTNVSDGNNTPLVPFVGSFSTSIMNLDLQSNKLGLGTLRYGTFRTGFGSVRLLTLQRNGLTAIENGAFSGLSALTNLDLTGNSLTSIQKAWTADLPSLTSLLIQQNQLSTLGQDAFSVLTKLSGLYLDNNQLTDVPDNVFSACASLRTLSITNNRLSTLRPTMFTGLKNLNSLQLSSNLITGPLAGDLFQSTPSIYTLGLSSNQLTSVQSDAFYSLRSLNSVDLSVNKITTISTTAFNPMNSTLNSINVNQNLLKTFPSLGSSTTAFVNLQSVDLTSNQFTAVAQNVVPATATIYIGSNPFNCTAGKATGSLCPTSGWIVLGNGSAPTVGDLASTFCDGNSAYGQTYPGVLQPLACFLAGTCCAGTDACWSAAQPYSNSICISYQAMTQPPPTVPTSTVSTSGSTRSSTTLAAITQPPSSSSSTVSSTSTVASSPPPTSTASTSSSTQSSTTLAAITQPPSSSSSTTFSTSPGTSSPSNVGEVNSVSGVSSSSLSSGAPSITSSSSGMSTNSVFKTNQTAATSLLTSPITTSVPARETTKSASDDQSSTLSAMSSVSLDTTALNRGVQTTTDSSARVDGIVTTASATATSTTATSPSANQLTTANATSTQEAQRQFTTQPNLTKSEQKTVDVTLTTTDSTTTFSSPIISLLSSTLSVAKATSVNSASSSSLPLQVNTKAVADTNSTTFGAATNAVTSVLSTVASQASSVSSLETTSQSKIVANPASITTAGETTQRLASVSSSSSQLSVSRQAGSTKSSDSAANSPITPSSESNQTVSTSKIIAAVTEQSTLPSTSSLVANESSTTKSLLTTTSLARNTTSSNANTLQTPTNAKTDSTLMSILTSVAAAVTTTRQPSFSTTAPPVNNATLLATTIAPTTQSVPPASGETQSKVFTVLSNVTATSALLTRLGLTTASSVNFIATNSTSNVNQINSSTTVASSTKPQSLNTTATTNANPDLKGNGTASSVAGVLSSDVATTTIPADVANSVGRSVTTATTVTKRALISPDSAGVASASAATSVKPTINLSTVALATTAAAAAALLSTISGPSNSTTTSKSGFTSNDGIAFIQELSTSRQHVNVTSSGPTPTSNNVNVSSLADAMNVTSPSSTSGSLVSKSLANATTATPTVSATVERPGETTSVNYTRQSTGDRATSPNVVLPSSTYGTNNVQVELSSVTDSVLTSKGDDTISNASLTTPPGNVTIVVHVTLPAAGTYSGNETTPYTSYTQSTNNENVVHVTLSSTPVTLTASTGSATAPYTASTQPSDVTQFVQLHTSSFPSVATTVTGSDTTPCAQPTNVTIMLHVTVTSIPASTVTSAQESNVSTLSATSSTPAPANSSRPVSVVVSVGNETTTQQASYPTSTPASASATPLNATNLMQLLSSTATASIAALRSVIQTQSSSQNDSVEALGNSSTTSVEIASSSTPVSKMAGVVTTASILTVSQRDPTRSNQTQTANDVTSSSPSTSLVLADNVQPQSKSLPSTVAETTPSLSSTKTPTSEFNRVVTVARISPSNSTQIGTVA